MLVTVRIGAAQVIHVDADDESLGAGPTRSRDLLDAVKHTRVVFALFEAKFLEPREE